MAERLHSSVLLRTDDERIARRFLLNQSNIQAPMESEGNCRVQIDAKFLRLGRQRLYIRGVSYGSFAESAHPCHPSANYTSFPFPFYSSIVPPYGVVKGASEIHRNHPREPAGRLSKPGQCLPGHQREGIAHQLEALVSEVVHREGDRRPASPELFG